MFSLLAVKFAIFRPRIRIPRPKLYNFSAGTPKKTGKREKHVKKLIFEIVFLNFGLWTPESANFDLKFEIYTKNHPQNRILRSGIENPGPKMELA